MTAAINSTGAGKRGYPTKSSVPYTQASTQRRARERSVAIQTLLLVRKSKSSSDRKSGSAGMPRPISYAVFCLKKKKIFNLKSAFTSHDAVSHKLHRSMSHGTEMS